MTLLLLVGVLPWALIAGSNIEQSYFHLVLGTFLVLLWIAVIVHELGHLVASLLMGLRVQEFAIKPLRFVREAGAFRLRFYISGNTGQVKAFPRNAMGLRQRMRVVIAAGPFANLLTTLVCLILAAWVDSAAIPLVPRSKPGFWLDFVALMNLAYFVANLMPGKEGPSLSDGSHYEAYRKEGSRHEYLLLYQALVTDMQAGTRPSAWNDSLLQRFLVLRDGSAADILANLYGYYHALDSGQRQAAGTFLDLAMQAVPPAKPGFDSVLLEKAYYEALHRRNSQAREWLDRSKGPDTEKHTRWRAEAAVLFVEGRYAEASTKAESALAEVPHSTDRGGSLAEAEWLQMLLAECNKHLTSSKEQQGIPASAPNLE
jgi:hypothetical protein